MKLIDPEKFYENKHLNKAQKEAQFTAINNFEAFIRLTAPYQLLAHSHIQLCRWVQDNAKVNKLILWPRDHGKSRMSAFFSAWQIIRNPAVTIIYASATAEKAEEQLRFVKTILTSHTTTKYFPGLFHEEEGRREAWNKTYIIVDHPHRKNEGVVDSTVMTCGLEKTITGKHCEFLILDDIVVPENNTEQGRRDVNSWAAQAASITSADSVIFAVGTRYNPKDAYSIMIDMVAKDISSGDDMEAGLGKVVEEALFEVNVANVEEDGDFLFPRQQRKDGKWFGFNWQILARKRAVYEASGEITQFFAQYYNDPNDKSTSPINRNLFQYYDRDKLTYTYGSWEIEGEPLHVYCAVDLAASKKESADYTVVIVGGVDRHKNRYLLEAKRFRTDKTSVIFESIQSVYEKYRFKGLRIEAVAGFRLVAQDLADRLHDRGIRIPIDIYIPPNTEAKAVRVNGILEPLYQTRLIYHYRGGNAQILEEELVALNPAHDDLKDAWSMCIDLMKPPIERLHKKRSNVLTFHPRFGGVAA